MSKNIYYENKFYRDSVVNICRCYCELGARYKEYGKAADVHGNRRKTIVARNACICNLDEERLLFRSLFQA